MKSRIRPWLLDLGLGFVAFALTMASAMTGHYDLRIYVAITVGVFFLLGFLRGGAPPPFRWAQTLRLGAVLLLFTGATSMGRIFAGAINLVGLTLLTTLAAIVACHLGIWLRQRPGEASLVGQAISTAAVLAAVAVVAWLAVPTLSRDLYSAELDVPAPPFAFITLDGTEVDSASMKGKVVILDFWGTWCAPCIASQPSLEELSQRYEDDDGVVFWSVNTTSHGDTLEKVREFVAASEHELPYAYDRDKAAAEALEVGGLPTLVLLDRESRIRYRHVGFDRSYDYVEHVAGKVDELLQTR